MKISNITLSMVLSGCLLGAVQAQSLRPVLNYETAVKLSEHCQETAREIGYNVAISIYDQSGILVVFDRMDGASVGAVEASFWKGRSAAIWEYSTVESATWNPHVPSLATTEGGTTIFTTEGLPIGGIGVSGAPAEFDGKCGRDAIIAVGLSTTRVTD